MNFEFSIPLQKDELLESSTGQYHVEDVVQPRVLLSKLQGQCIRDKLLFKTNYHSFIY